jgi:hypothetical protein
MRVAEPNPEQQHDGLGDTPLSADPLPHGARVHAEFLGRAIAFFVWIGAAQEASMVQMRSALAGIRAGTPTSMPCGDK